MRTGERTWIRARDFAGYTERLEFVPFDALSGRKVLPDDLKKGDVVRVLVNALPEVVHPRR